MEAIENVAMQYGKLYCGLKQSSMKTVVFGENWAFYLEPNNLLAPVLITNMSLRKLRSHYGKHGKKGKQDAIYSASLIPCFPCGYAWFPMGNLGCGGKFCGRQQKLLQCDSIRFLVETAYQLIFQQFTEGSHFGCAQPLLARAPSLKE
jgi:hypothetical protein